MPVQDPGKERPNHQKPQWPRSKNKKAFVGLAPLINAYKYEQRTNRDQEESEENSKKWREIWTLIFIIFTTIGVFIQAAILNSTDRTMERQIRISVRPWVGLTDDGNPIETTLIQFDENGDARIEYKIITKNFSNAAAQGISAGAGLIISENLASVFALRDELCKNRFAGEKSYGALSFAGKVQPGVMSGAIAFKRNIAVSSDGKTQAWLFGCIG
jgi:hypothetical protein